MSKKQCPPAGAPGWVVSYSDLMSLLFTFFVMLFILSTVDAKKTESVIQSLQITFGSSKNSFYNPFPGQETQLSSSSGLKSSRSMTVETIQSGNPTRSLIPVTKPKEKITTGVILFENESDTLSKDAIVSLQEIYQRLKGTQLMIEIRGHTGRNEQQGPNRDMMDLAYARAFMVRQHLINLGIDPVRVFITSWGSNRSSGTVVPSQVGASNAYVEVVLISETPESSN